MRALINKLEKCFRCDGRWKLYSAGEVALNCNGDFQAGSMCMKMRIIFQQISKHGQWLNIWFKFLAFYYKVMERVDF